MITGHDILAVISERFLIDITPEFTYSKLDPHQKDVLNRYVLPRIDYSFACEIVPGAAEHKDLIQLFVSNPMFYMDKLRTLIARDYSDNYEVMLVTEATIKANLNKTILKMQLDNDAWEFFRNVSYAAMEYLQGWIEDRINDDLAEFLVIQRGMAKEAFFDSMIRSYRSTGVIQ